MENLRRLGGEAGVLAGVAMAWLFLGFVVLFPSAGLNLVDQGNPHRYLPFIARHASMFWVVNILGALVAGLLSAVVYMALHDRFKDESPATARIGSFAGTMGAAAFAAAALVRHTGFGWLSTIYATNGVGAAHAFYAVSTVAGSFMGLGNVMAGLGILLFGRVMQRHPRYNSLGYLSMGAGTVMVLAGFVTHPFSFAVSTISAMAWFTRTALALRAEAGPALFRWGTAKSRANGRTQRRVA